jgi:hypothetical protein
VQSFTIQNWKIQNWKIQNEAERKKILLTVRESIAQKFLTKSCETCTYIFDGLGFALDYLLFQQRGVSLNASFCPRTPLNLAHAIAITGLLKALRTRTAAGVAVYRLLSLNY